MTEMRFLMRLCEGVIAYHGTSDPTFKRFKYRGGFGGKLGYWFASSRDSAKMFARKRYAGIEPGIKRCMLDVKRPMVYQGYTAYLDAVNARKGDTIEDKVISLRRSLIKNGYDGVLISESDTDMAGVRDDWVAFYPQQITELDVTPVGQD